MRPRSQDYVNVIGLDTFHVSTPPRLTRLQRYCALKASAIDGATLHDGSSNFGGSGQRQQDAVPEVREVGTKKQKIGRG